MSEKKSKQAPRVSKMSFNKALVNIVHVMILSYNICKFSMRTLPNTQSIILVASFEIFTYLD